MSSNLNIVFAGTPAFSVPTFKALLAAGYPVTAAYTQPDRPAGRGRKLASSPVKQLALAQGIPVFQPRNFRDERDLMALEALGADLMVVVAYGLILPGRVLAAPRHGCINIHASLLPRWRGAAPIQRAILAGDQETGVTIMQMEAGLDTGPILLKRRCSIGPEETAGSLHDKLARMGAEALLEVLPRIADGSIGPVQQEEAGATYANKLEKSEAEIDWNRSCRELDLQVRAFNPWPVAQTGLDGKTLRIWESTPLPGPVGVAPPGTVVATGKEGIDVATGVGLLRILKLQLPGKKAMMASDFLNAQELNGVLFG